MANWYASPDIFISTVSDWQKQSEQVIRRIVCSDGLSFHEHKEKTPQDSVGFLGIL
ncbi:MAG: hypothetical protein U5L75_02960 [Candidatus Campbellbacteria bacterium]|nr:hypothetical protein [Candidatus Campbellbacteria bacterium]